MLENRGSAFVARLDDAFGGVEIGRREGGFIMVLGGRGCWEGRTDCAFGRGVRGAGAFEGFLLYWSGHCAGLVCVGEVLERQGAS